MPKIEIDLNELEAGKPHWLKKAPRLTKRTEEIREKHRARYLARLKKAKKP